MALVLCVLMLSGCFDYSDMNKLFFGTMGIYDVDDSGMVTIYSECFKAYRGEGEKAGKETRVLFKGTGLTAYDAFFNMARGTSFPLEYSQSKATVFTEKAATKGLQPLLDGPSRNQKFNPKQYIFVCSDKPEELLNTQMSDEQFVGLFLDNMMLSQGAASYIIQMRMDDLKVKRTLGSGVYVLPIIQNVDEPAKERIQISGGAVMLNDKMVDKLNDSEVASYNYLTNQVKAGPVLAELPDHEKKYVTMEILKSKTKGSIAYDGNSVQVTKKINMMVTVEAVQDIAELNDDTFRKRITDQAEERIKQDCLELFKNYQDRGIDLMNITADFQKKYPGASADGLLEKAKLDVEVHILIEGSQNLNDAQ